jgi:hypothetical protein
MICCTPMENRAGKSDTAQQAGSPRRGVRLHHAIIRTDSSRLHRTAEFTDGTTRAVEMKWSDVRRVAAFRRDVLTQPVVCVAVTDPSNVVVLDESMQGWKHLIDSLAKHLRESPSFTEWRDRIGQESPDSHWTILFSAGQ